MDPRAIRELAGLSVRGMAEAAGVAASTVHRIEKGRISPTIETLRALAQAAGQRLVIRAEPDHAASLSGLSRALADPDTRRQGVRLAAETASRFLVAAPDERHRMLAAEPLSTGDPRWDALLGALAEWLAVRAGQPTPIWAFQDSRYLRRGWWVGASRAMQAWEYAGAPLAFKLRGVYIHRESLTNV